MASKENIIVIDSEESIRKLMSDYFEALGYRVHTTTGISEGNDIISANKISVALLDTGPSPGAVIKSIDRLKQNHPGLKVILITGYPTIDAIINALRHGVFDIVVKPFRLDDLKEIVGKALTSSEENEKMDQFRRRIELLENLLRMNGITVPKDGEYLSDAVPSSPESVQVQGVGKQPEINS